MKALRWIKIILGSFFCSGTDGKFKAVYFWSTLFLTLTAIAICNKIKSGIQTADIAIMTGLIIGLIALYNQGKGKNRTNMVSIIGKSDINKIDLKKLKKDPGDVD